MLQRHIIHSLVLWVAARMDDAIHIEVEIVKLYIIRVRLCGIHWYLHAHLHVHVHVREKNNEYGLVILQMYMYTTVHVLSVSTHDN